MQLLDTVMVVDGLFFVMIHFCSHTSFVLATSSTETKKRVDVHACLALLAMYIKAKHQ